MRPNPTLRPRMPVPLLALSVLLLAGCGAQAGKTLFQGEGAVVSGKVTFRGAPVPDAIVTLYDRYATPDRHSAARVRTDSEGAFSASAAPGIYYIEAEGTVEGKPVFAFTGQNPVRLDRGTRPVSLKAVPRTDVSTAPGPPERGAILEGEVFFAGKPVEGASVHVYSSPDGLLKGMGTAMSPPTGPDGRFAVENLPESSYYIVARRRGAAASGPLAAGELYGFFPGNPVLLRDRTVTRIRIEAVEKETRVAPSR